jgi:hypothetical protein
MRTALVLACTAAAGVGLMFAGHALAAPRLSPLSKSSVLSFNPFQPSRTTTLRRPGTTTPGLATTPGSTDPTGGTWIPGTPVRRPPIRDPFRPPTRSPIAPIDGNQ